MEKKKIVRGIVLILLLSLCVYYRQPLLHLLGWFLLGTGLICFILRLLWRRRGLILASPSFIFCSVTLNRHSHAEHRPI
ncbi:hypothetical protein [Alistipes sp. AF48-12]|uniref:hypothetical protein n=1 Tax=Alistipes sp. AF48-12 TaxID=2291998 RepID=UPI0011C432E6|nr:hypothetical protein [Alistipes sp. AF48-12]